MLLHAGQETRGPAPRVRLYCETFQSVPNVRSGEVAGLSRPADGGETGETIPA